MSKDQISPAFNAAANPPRKTHAEKQIEALNGQRRAPEPQPTLTPKGPGVKGVLAEVDRKHNEALDRKIAFWEEQIESQRAAKDRARSEFNKVKGGLER